MAEILRNAMETMEFSIVFEFSTFDLFARHSTDSLMGVWMDMGGFIGNYGFASLTSIA